jgi:inosose dehydratase
VVLYRPDVDPAPVVNQVLDGFKAVGAEVLVLSADSGMVGYDARPELDSVGWSTLLANLDRLTRVALHQ